MSLFFTQSGRHKVLLTLRHTDCIHSAAFIPDGQHIITTRTDKTARVWDATSRQALLTLQGHTDTVTSAAFSPDGKRIVTVSEDSTVRT